MAESDAALEAELAKVAQVLESRSHTLIERQQQALEQFPDYQNVPKPDLGRSCARNVARVVAMLRGEPRLPPEVNEDERLSGEQRARQGIPAEIVVAAYRAVIGVIRDDYLETAPVLGTSVEAILLGVRRLWTLTDHMSSTLVAARYQVELEQTRETEQTRVTLLHGVLDGSATPADLLETGGDYGFNDSSQYWVVRGDVDTGSAGEVVRQIERVSATKTFIPLVTRHGGTIVGIIGRQLQRVDPRSATVAVVGPVQLSGIPAAAYEAATILDVAKRLGQRGIVDRPSMSLRMTVVEQQSVGQLLHSRYIEPVRVGSSMPDDILETLRVFLAYRRSAQAAAVAMSLHVNTLRYRIEKFEDLTGYDLSETDVLVETWWALQYESAGADGPGSK